MPVAKRKPRVTLPSRKRAKKEQRAATKAAVVEAREQKQREEGDHVRILAPKGVVISFIKARLANKLATSQAGQQMSTETKRASDAGVNIPAAVSATRTIGMAQRDGMKARVYLEDYLYYLELFDFDGLAPKMMFTPQEAGLGKKPAVQLDLEPAANGGGETQSQPMPGDVGPMMTH